MLKAFDRYILKEIASPFGIGLMVYTFTLLSNQILRLSYALISKGASAEIIMKILIFLLPSFLAFTIPMSVIMGVLAGLSRMSTDSEIMAFRTMGINNRRILKPVMIFACLAWFFSIWLIMYVAPEANFHLNRLIQRVHFSQTVSDIKPMTFKNFRFYHLIFRDFKKNTNEWEHVFLYSTKNPQEDTVIQAESGGFLQDPADNESYIVLNQATIHSYKKKDPHDTYSKTTAERKLEKIRHFIPIKQTRGGKELIFPQLTQKMKEQPKNLSIAIEFHRKFSQPFTCLVLAFLGLSLGISTRKGGKTTGFIISLGIIFISYVVMTASENLILKKILPPFIGMWAANFFLLIAGIIFYTFSAKEKEIRWDRLLDVFHRQRKPKRHKINMILKLKKISIKPFKTLDLYILYKLSLIFLLVSISLILVFYIIEIIDRVDEIVNNKVPFHYLLQYIYHNTPEILRFVLPIAALTSVLLTFLLMTNSNEVVAVQVSGISLYRLTLPAIFLGIMLSVGSFILQEKVLPKSNKRAYEILNIIYKRNPVNVDRFHRNWILGKNNEIYFYKYFEKERDRFVDFNIIYLDKNFNMTKRISVKHAHWFNRHGLLLTDGFERNFNPDVSITNAFKGIKHRRLRVAETPEYFTRKIRYYQNMNIRELKQYINYLKSNNADTQRYEARLYDKYAFPFSNLVMVLIAVPFSFMMGKRGNLFGIGIAVVISMTFWGVTGIFSSLGSTAMLTPFISAFAPLFLFFAISAFLLLYVKA